MPTLTSPHFAHLVYDAADVLEFPRGLPGFEHERRFLALERDGCAPLVFLQSLTSPALCFVCLPAESIVPDFRVELSPEDLGAIGLPPHGLAERDASVLYLAILRLPADGDATANLAAPVVINLAARRGLQAVPFEPRYGFDMPLPQAGPVSVCS